MKKFLLGCLTAITLSSFSLTALAEDSVNASGVYVLRQGVSEDLDINHSTPNSNWNVVDTKAEIIFAEDGFLQVVNDKNHTSANLSLNEEEFLKALNYAVTGDAEDDSYLWKYNKVILENDGYHLDVLAYVPSYTITFVGGDKEVQTTVMRNDKVSPATLTKEGFEFEGYYADEACTIPFDFNINIRQNYTVYSKWLAIEPDPEPSPVRPVVDPTPVPTIIPVPIVTSEPVPSVRPIVTPEPTEESIETPTTAPEVTIQPTATPTTESKEENNAAAAAPEPTPEIQETSTETPAPTAKPAVKGVRRIKGAVQIEDDEVPLAASPSTGEEYGFSDYLSVFVLALIGGLLFGYLSEKDKEDKED